MTVLFVGDDWAADHHDVELMDQARRTLARARLSEGAAGMARLHVLTGEHAGVADGEDELEARLADAPASVPAMAGVLSLRSETTNIPATSAGPTRRSGVPAAIDATAPAMVTTARSHGGQRTIAMTAKLT